MVKAGALAVTVVVCSALCGYSDGFMPQPVSVSKAASTPATKQLTFLHAFNPFSKQEAAPVVAEVVKAEPVPGPLGFQNYVAGAVWVALVSYAFLLAPGELNAPADTEMVTRLATQPFPRPDGMNELWFSVWNCVTVVPAVIAALEAPVGRGQRLPATPFLWGSAAFGYFSLGPYFLTRTAREEPVELEDLGFASRNIFENKIFGVLLSGIALSIPFSSGLVGSDLGQAVAGYGELFASSRFVAVASVDIALMSALAAVLVAEDAARRGWEDKALPLLAATLLLPVLGPSLYLVARPSLEEQ